MSVEFWKATGIRAIRTFAQGMLGAIGTTAIGVTEVDWVGAASIGATAAIVSVLMAFAGLPEVPALDKAAEAVEKITSGNGGE